MLKTIFISYISGKKVSNIIDNNEKDIGFNISLLVSENNIKNREVKLIKENNFYDEWIWFIENNDWRNVDNNNENFIITILFGATISSRRILLSGGS